MEVLGFLIFWWISFVMIFSKTSGKIFRKIKDDFMEGWNQ